MFKKMDFLNVSLFLTVLISFLGICHPMDFIDSAPLLYVSQEGGQNQFLQLLKDVKILFCYFYLVKLIHF